MPDVAAAPTTARRAAPWLLLGAALVGGYFLVRRPDAPPPRPAPGDVLLALDAPVAPLSRRIRVKMPCTVRVQVDLPAGVAAEVSLGPPQPQEKSPEDAPDPDAARRWKVESGKPHDEIVLAAGLYVVRVVPEAAASGTMKVHVRAMPP